MKPMNQLNQKNPIDQKNAKMKKAMIFMAVILVLGAVSFCISGMIPRNDVCMGEYEVSEDGKKITMDVFVSSSMGYIGSYRAKEKENAVYITFYSTIGGLNCSMGSGNQVELTLSENCEAVYFNCEGGEYIQKLVKNSSGEWIRVTQ